MKGRKWTSLGLEMPAPLPTHPLLKTSCDPAGDTGHTHCYSVFHHHDNIPEIIQLKGGETCPSSQSFDSDALGQWLHSGSRQEYPHGSQEVRSWLYIFNFISLDPQSLCPPLPIGSQTGPGL